MIERFIQCEHQGMTYIYREAVVHPIVQQFLDNYPVPEVAAGQCDEFATMLADVFRSIGEDNFEVFGLLVNGKASHIVLKKDGIWYDPTGIQFGQPLKVFTDETMPPIYKIHKKLDNRQYTNNKMEKTYVTNPSDAPEGVALKTGPKGGKYYDEPVGDSLEKTTPKTVTYINSILSKLQKDSKKDNFSMQNRSFIQKPIPNNFVEFKKSKKKILSQHEPHHCYYHSLNTAKQNPKMGLAVGLHIQDINDLKKHGDLALEQGEGKVFQPIGMSLHAWNLDEKGEVNDTTFGNKNPNDKNEIYIGETVNPNNFKDDTELEDYLWKKLLDYESPKNVEMKENK